MSPVSCCSRSHWRYLAFQPSYILFGIIKSFCENAGAYVQKSLPPCAITSHLVYPYNDLRKLPTSYLIGGNPKFRGAWYCPRSCREGPMPVCLQNCGFSAPSLVEVPEGSSPEEYLTCSSPSGPISTTQIRKVRLKPINRGRVG